jgi:hypothetical protein
MKSDLMEPIEQLQRLRRRSLFIHAACVRWGAENADDMQLVMTSALMARRIARAVGDWLNVQPNWRLHPRPSTLGHWGLAAIGFATAHTHSSNASRRHWLQGQFEKVGRESADIRAITSSRVINDMLAGLQPEVKALMRLLAACEEHPQLAASA